MIVGIPSSEWDDGKVVVWVGVDAVDNVLVKVGDELRVGSYDSREDRPGEGRGDRRRVGLVATLGGLDGWVGGRV